ncbi:hypothetical protein [Candidatus Nitrosocosmicus sp. T]
MNYNCTNTFIGIFIMISAIITTLMIYQSSYAQLQESVLNATKPPVDNIYSTTQQSPIQYLHEPILIVNGNNDIHIVWEEIVDGKSEIFYTKRTSDGFSYKTNLSLSSSVDSIKPSMLVDNQTIHFTWWEKYDNGTQIPMFRASSDNGITFGGNTILSKIPY